MDTRFRVATSLVVAALSSSMGCGDDAASSGSSSGGGATSGATESSTPAATGSGGEAGAPASSASGDGGGGDGGDMSAPSASSGSGGETGAGGGSSWWTAPAGMTWQIQYVDYPVDRSFDVAMYDIDLVEISDDDLEALRSEERFVVCYFSAGTWEPYRPDADAFPDEVLGNDYDDPAFDDERYVDITSDVVRGIMQDRLDLARDRGCDGVDPDNMNLDEVGEDITGLPIGAAEQLDYSRFIAAEAHARGLAVGLKNSIEHAAELEPHFDFAVNEQCFEYDECDVYAGSFIAADKAVFHVEYTDEGSFAEVCAGTVPLGISSILKSYDLDAPRVGCE